MGLDVCVREFVEIPDEITTEEQLQEFCGKHGYSWTVYEENHKNFPKKWLKEIQVEFTDFEASFKALGLNYEEYEWFMSCATEYGFVKKGCDPEKRDGNTVYLKGKQVKTQIKKVPVFVSGRVVGYQRKGANAKFYEDGKWDDNTIVSSRQMLLEDWVKYFSDPNDPYYGKEARDNFRNNIINHFVEGKTFVWYC